MFSGGEKGCIENEFDNINPFLSNALFLYVLKTSENLMALEKNELNPISYCSVISIVNVEYNFDC